MTQSAQLILTHGISDLQILLRTPDNTLLRAVPEKKLVRRFHTWLLTQTDHAQVVPLPAELQDRNRSEATLTDFELDGRFTIITPNHEESSAQADLTPGGQWQLVLPKISPVIQAWLKQKAAASAQQQSTAMAQALLSASHTAVGTSPPTNTLVSVLVLSTDRGEAETSEPIATTTYLQQWLCSIGQTQTPVQECVYLREGENLERNEPQRKDKNTPVDTEKSRRIEQAVRTFYLGEKTPLLLAHQGGLPQIKPLLDELVVMLAGSRAQNLFSTEHGAHGILPLTVIDELRTRRLCLEQVRRAALIEAQAMAAVFHSKEATRPWVQPLREAAQLLNGNPIGRKACLPALQTILNHSENAASLLVAIRVEVALQNEHWLDAINGSITFLEAAFHDSIGLWAKNNLKEYEPRLRKMRFRQEPPRALTEFPQGEGSPALRLWKYSHPADLTYQANVVGEAAIKAWASVLDNPAINALRSSIFESQTYKGSSFRLSDYRNYNTHGVMSQPEIDQALARFMGANLWSQGSNTPASRPRPGNCFLSRPLVQNTLASLLGSQVNAASLLQTLLVELEQRLIDPESLPAATT